MDTNLKLLSDFVNKLDNYKLPEYNELPQIPLYMEQVVSYIIESLQPLYSENDQVLTPFMVNNYVKAKIIMPPKHKKYSKEHISSLMSISLLKNVVSMRDIATLQEIEKRCENSGEKFYDFFKNLQNSAAKNEAKRIKGKVDDLQKIKKKGKKGSNEPLSDIDLLGLTRLALELYVDSEINKIVADDIMKMVSSVVLPKKVMEETKTERNLDKKKQEKEAKKLKDR
jgi:hypothetical protein